ncbi:hypothetical protein ABW20_dc0102360 [Dactylellina cionopaga]|nr:hypothetical protein ABW20_dc0102360 [Dactylellina cionopaga]
MASSDLDDPLDSLFDERFLDDFEEEEQTSLCLLSPVPHHGEQASHSDGCGSSQQPLSLPTPQNIQGIRPQANNGTGLQGLLLPGPAAPQQVPQSQAVFDATARATRLSPTTVAPQSTQSQPGTRYYPGLGLYLPPPAPKDVGPQCEVETIAPSQLYTGPATQSNIQQRAVIHSLVSPTSPIELATSPESAASPSVDGDPSGRTKRKNKPRSNWTDGESERLLQGVEVYGIGNWAKIRQDPTFELGHRKNVDLKDRFRTVFPNEYRLHNDQLKAKKGLPLTPSTFTSGLSSGTTPENPIFVELDYKAARMHKKLTRKKQKKKDDEPASETQSPTEVPVSVPLTTASGRRKVVVKKGVPWTAEEDADLKVAFETHKRRWRSMAADRSLAFYGRAIQDIRDRFTHLFPELVVPRTSLSPDPDPANLQISTFEQGLVNSFGTTGVSRSQARRISEAALPSNSQLQISAPRSSRITYPASPISPIGNATLAENISQTRARNKAAPSPTPGDINYTPSISRCSSQQPSHILESNDPNPSCVIEGLSNTISRPQENDTRQGSVTAFMSPVSMTTGANSPFPTPITSFSSSPDGPCPLEPQNTLPGSRETSPLELGLAGAPQIYSDDAITPTHPGFQEQHRSPSPPCLFDAHNFDPNIDPFLASRGIPGGNFDGNFAGILDGSFIGSFDGNFAGNFNGYLDGNFETFTDTFNGNCDGLVDFDGMFEFDDTFAPNTGNFDGTYNGTLPMSAEDFEREMWDYFRNGNPS